MTSLEEELIKSIENSFDVIYVCYFSIDSLCCHTAEVLSELESNITRGADKLGIIGQITAKFSTEFNLVINYADILSEWTVVSAYPYEICQTSTTTKTMTTTPTNTYSTALISTATKSLTT